MKPLRFQIFNHWSHWRAHVIILGYDRGYSDYKTEQYFELTILGVGLRAIVPYSYRIPNREGQMSA